MTKVGPHNLTERFPLSCERERANLAVAFTRAIGVRAALALPVVFTLLLTACTSSRTLTTDPIKWVDPDNKTIPEPVEVVENQIWDIADHTVFYQVRKILDLSWTAHRLGSIVGVVDHRQADNVNALDEAVAQLGGFVEQIDSLDGGGNDAGRDGVRKEIRA